MSGMKHGLIMIIVSALLAGCAGGTTDPRQGGLFSYNPEAYEQRARERREHLAAVEQDNQTLNSNAARLETYKAGQLKEKETLQNELKTLAVSMTTLEKQVKAKQAKTAAQKKEQQRILAELNALKSASRPNDNVENPESKRLEVERLKQRRDQLEKEAANLMKL